MHGNHKLGSDKGVRRRRTVMGPVATVVALLVEGCTVNPPSSSRTEVSAGGDGCVNMAGRVFREGCLW